jgi:hypothetical protein
MNATPQTPCACNTCPGAACNCGCQQAAARVVAQAACACGPQCACGAQCNCGTQCTCGDSARCAQA